MAFIFLYLWVSAMQSEKFSRDEVFWAVTSILIMFLPSIYFVLSLYKLLHKKIYIQTTQDYLKKSTSQKNLVTTPCITLIIPIIIKNKIPKINIVVNTATKNPITIVNTFLLRLLS